MRPVHEQQQRSLVSLIHENSSSSGDDDEDQLKTQMMRGGRRLMMVQQRPMNSTNSICESLPPKSMAAETSIDYSGGGSVFQTMWQSEGLCCRADDLHHVAQGEDGMDELVFFEDIDDQEFETETSAGELVTNDYNDEATAFSVGSNATEASFGSTAFSMLSSNFRFGLGEKRYVPRPSSTTPSIRDFPKLFDGWENNSSEQGHQLQRSSRSCDGINLEDKPFQPRHPAAAATVSTVKPKATRPRANSTTLAPRAPQEPVQPSSLPTTSDSVSSAKHVFPKLQLSRNTSRSLPAQSLSRKLFQESRARSTDMSSSSGYNHHQNDQWMGSWAATASDNNAAENRHSPPPAIQELGVAAVTSSTDRRSPTHALNQKMKSLVPSFRRSVKSWIPGSGAAAHDDGGKSSKRIYSLQEGDKSNRKNHRETEDVKSGGVVFLGDCSSEVEFQHQDTTTSGTSAFGRVSRKSDEPGESDASDILASLEATLKARKRGVLQKRANHRATTLRQQKQLQRGVYIQPGGRKDRPKDQSWESSTGASHLSRNSASSPRPGRHYCNTSNLTEDTEQSDNSSFDDIFCGGGSWSGEDSLLDGDSTILSASSQSSGPGESVLSAQSSHAPRSRNVRIHVSTNGLDHTKDRFTMDDPGDISRCNSVDTAKISNLSYDPVGQDRLNHQALLALKEQEEEMRKMRDAPPIDFDAGNNLIRVRDFMCEIEVLPKHQLSDTILEEEEWTTPETVAMHDTSKAKARGNLVSRVIAGRANRAAPENGMPNTAAEF